MHLGVGFAVLVFGMVLFATGTFGGGDAKLLAVGALWMGPSEVLPFVAFVAIFGGVLAVLMLAYRRCPITLIPVPVPAWATRLHQRDCGIPYGIAIAAAALLAFPATGLYALIVA
jgi:prepilin peptidase CpaA